jgi:ubiquinone/menaquinone biosynthesis C-methylase UbiE
MLIPLARQISSSKIYGTEIEDDAIRELREFVKQAKLSNIEIVQANSHETKLPKDSCNAIVMSDVYHHFTDPSAMAGSLFESVRIGGRLAVIDFAPTPILFWLDRPMGVPENRGGHGIPARLVVEELGRAGWAVERVIEDWWVFVPRRYCVLARKPSSRQNH